ncbi:MAG: hypothetical protein EAZ30_10160 [Betaproteobacteria bacterium]|nr:MAG: hypothetical protein EAZ30_10160 [Betaproteobacteria bacterium]
MEIVQVQFCTFCVTLTGQSAIVCAAATKLANPEQTSAVDARKIRSRISRIAVKNLEIEVYANVILRFPTPTYGHFLLTNGTTFRNV